MRIAKHGDPVSVDVGAGAKIGCRSKCIVSALRPGQGTASVAHLMQTARMETVDDQRGIAPGCQAACPDKGVLRDAIASMQDDNGWKWRLSFGQNDRAHLMLAQYADCLVGNDRRGFCLGTGRILGHSARC